jgi:hypothetical protein
MADFPDRQNWLPHEMSRKLETISPVDHERENKLSEFAGATAHNLAGE